MKPFGTRYAPQMGKALQRLSPILALTLIVAGITVPAASAAEVARAVAPATASSAPPDGDASAEADALAAAAHSGKRVEVTPDRTETDTTFANPDGTLTTEISQVPVRARDANGDWQPVDTTLGEDHGRLAPQASTADTTLSATGDGPLATLDTAGTTSLSMSYGGDLGTPNVSGDTASYPTDADHTQVQASVGGSGFSAHVLLDQAPDTSAGSPTYSFPLQLQGLTASLEHGQLLFRDATGTVVAYSAPLEMWDSQVDAGGDPSHVAAVNATLVSGPGGQQTLQLTPSADFLTDPSTQYPVTIDPDVSALNNHKDTFVNSASPDTFYGDRYLSRVGSDDGSRRFRSFERFDIDRYLGTNVVHASLSMFQYYAGSCAQASLTAYPVQQVDYTVAAMTTWNNQPNLVVPSNRWSSQLANNASTNCTNNRRSIDVTTLMSGYTTEALSSANGPSNTPDDQQNHVATIELRADNETSTTFDQRFCAMNAAAAPSGSPCLGSGKVPVLSMTYTGDLGDVDSYSTTDHKLNDRATLKINNDNGNALIKADDVQIQSLGIPLHLSRYYNSQSVADTSLGSKWSLSLGPDVRFIQTPDDDDRFDYTDPTGKLYGGFMRSPSDPHAFSSPDGGIDSNLVQNSDGSLTLTKHSDQKEMTFRHKDLSTNAWVLTSVKDRSGNAITVNYPTGSAQMSSITDASGHVLKFTWVSGRVTTITDDNVSPARTWTYGYTGNLMTTYTDPATKVTDYGWTTDADPRVSSVTDPANDSGMRPTVNLTTINGQATSVRYLGAGTTSVGFDFSYYSTVVSRCADDGHNYDSSTNVTSTDTTKGPVTYCFRERDAASDKAQRTVDGNGHRSTTSFTLDNQPSSFALDGGGSTGSTIAAYGTGAQQDRLASVTSPTDPGSSSGASTTLKYNAPSDTNGHNYLPTNVAEANGTCKTYVYDDNNDGDGNDSDNGLLTDTYLTSSANCGTKNGARFHQEYTTNSAGTGPGNGNVAWSSAPAADNVDDRTNYTYYPAQDQATIDEPYVAGAVGLLKRIKLPGGSCSPTARKLCTSYTYDPVGRIKTETDGRGNVTSYDYDKLDRPVAVHVNGDTSCDTGGGNCIRYVYDAEGELTARFEAAGTTNFDYDRLNRQIRQDSSDGSRIDYAYNPDGKLIQLDATVPGSPKHTWTYDYDAGDQQTGVTGGPGGKIYLDHDNNNKDKYIKFPTTYPVTETRTYTEKAQRPKAITVTKADAHPENDVLPDWTYSYVKKDDGADSTQQQSATVKNAADSTLNQSIDYTYSNYGLLSKADSDTGTDYSYGYSSNFDLASEKVASGGSSTTTYYGFDKAGQLCWQGPNDSTSNITSSCAGATPSGDTPLSQDAAGNSLGTSTTPFTYNAFNQVASIGARAQQYNDQGNDRRISTGSISSGGAKLINTSIGVVARTTSAGTTFYTRAPSGKILAEDGPGTGSPDPDVFYYLTDYHGSVVGLLDPVGNLAAWYRYSPYGTAQITNGTSTTAGQTNPWRYIGGYHDIEGDGYTQLKARYYDNHGHFTQVDPKAGDLADPLTTCAYTYASDDPINGSDPSGRSVCGAATALGGAGLYLTGLGLIVEPPSAGISTVIVAAGGLVDFAGLTLTVVSCLGPLHGAESNPAYQNPQPAAQ